MMNKARIIAYYLPQYHPIPENDKWWGKGFTEWTNVGKAKPLFKGHYQPKVPADLGYYDLRLPEVREAQARMAQETGVYGFCYWHYWFGNGKQLLEKPIKEVVESGKPDFPFCFGWANESWKAKVWGIDKYKKDKILIEQLYPGKEDNELHFYTLLEAFKDKRYIKVEGKPLFYIYKPLEIPSVKYFLEQWNCLAKKNGLNGFFFVASTPNFKMYSFLIENGFNAITLERTTAVEINLPKIIRNPLRILRQWMNIPLVISYKCASNHFIVAEEDSITNVFPAIIPNWDHSPRSGRNANILHNSTPELFEKHVRKALEVIKNKPEEYKVIFLKSWNEWGEGNFIEPDIKFKHGYLDALRNTLK